MKGMVEHCLTGTKTTTITVKSYTVWITDTEPARGIAVGTVTNTTHRIAVGTVTNTTLYMEVLLGQ